MLGASPVQLVVMLYDGALRFMEQGKAAMATGNRFRQNQQIQRAQQIVMELMSTLDMVRGGEISTNLLALYTYIIEQLLTGNIEDQVEPIERSIRIMSELRESWNELDKIARVSGPAANESDSASVAMAA